MSSANRSPAGNPPASEFLDGVRTGLPGVMAAGPFALLFGALAVQNGLTFGETVLMSATVFAGASQMVGIELFGQSVAPWLIVLSIFAVNFRHVLYSASIGRLARHWEPWQRAVGFFFLADPQYAESERRGERDGRIGFVWFLGLALPLYCWWIAGGVIGASFGNLIPDPQAFGIDFLLPIYFLGLVMGFRKRPLWLPVVGASAAASIAAFYLIGSPWHVSVGAAAGVALAVILTPVDGEGSDRR